MSNSQEQEALARQLWSIFDEAWPDGSLITFEDLKPPHREAWIQVAQYVEARSNEPMATDDNPIVKAYLVSGYDEPIEVKENKPMTDDEFRKWLSNQGGKSSPRFA